MISVHTKVLQKKTISKEIWLKGAQQVLHDHDFKKYVQPKDFTSLHIGHTKIVEYGSSDASRGAIVAITSATT